MVLKAYLKADSDVLLPAVLGLAVISLTILALHFLRHRKVASQLGGSRYVTGLDGSQVRRSTRCDFLVRNSDVRCDCARRRYAALEVLQLWK